MLRVEKKLNSYSGQLYCQNLDCAARSRTLVPATHLHSSW